MLRLLFCVFLCSLLSASASAFAAEMLPLPALPAIPADNSMTNQKVELGRCFSSTPPFRLELDKLRHLP